MKVLIPNDHWEEGKEGVIVSWIYSNGAQVTEGEAICEVMVEKIQSDFLAPVSGVLSIVAEADSIVELGEHIANID
ncbi:MAG: pyruvate/2-oxoglutarate dehydrogenase complex dihydrolipoamide acyltransferase (E2) component [Shewanella sp.]|jgi:pyruvate/2-oxoglutarate dehydrogenase complex dihydrolipoamide acyltransferase (E2) component